LDTDTVFYEPENAPAIETLFGWNLNTKHQNLTHSHGGLSIYMPGDQGWNTDTMFFRNTAYSHAFLAHVWGLRFACPHCNGEQCAFMVSMLDSIISHVHGLNQTQMVSVLRSKKELLCSP
jgi:hypothetical protein